MDWFSGQAPRAKESLDKGERTVSKVGLLAPPPAGLAGYSSAFRCFLPFCTLCARAFRVW